MLTVLNAGRETPGPTRYLVIRNKPGTPDFVYNSLQDGFLPGVPAEDRDGNPHDFTASAGLMLSACLQPCLTHNAARPQV